MKTELEILDATRQTAEEGFRKIFAETFPADGMPPEINAAITEAAVENFLAGYRAAFNVIKLVREREPKVEARDPNVKHPVLFYYEDAQNAYVPAPEKVEQILSTESMYEGEVVSIDFKRADMTDAELEALPEE